MDHHRRPLVRLLRNEPIILYQLKFCYQVSQEPVRQSWHTWYSVFWQRTTVCFQKVKRICIRQALWPPNILTILSTIEWQDRKCCKDSQGVSNQSKGKWTRSILGHFRLAQHTHTLYWIITSPKIIWKTHTVTYSINFVTAKDLGGDWRKAQRKEDEASTVLQQGNKRATWASTQRHSAQTAANRQWLVVEKGIGCQTSRASFSQGRSPRNCVQE